MEQRRKESQVKFTEKLLPMKRSRGCKSDSVALLIDLMSHHVVGGQTQPKTLFQKTRSDAAKMQKGLYGARIPTPQVKTLRVPNPPSAKMSFKPASTLPNSAATPSNGNGTCVTVTAVPRRPPPTVPGSSVHSSVRSPAKPAPSAAVPTPQPDFPFLTKKTSSTDKDPSPPSLLSPASNESSGPHEMLHPVTFKQSPPVKKDPMATIFMPKHRSYSQLPTQRNGMRSRV